MIQISFGIQQITKNQNENKKQQSRQINFKQLSEMNQVSQFSVHQGFSLNHANSSTPQTFHSKYLPQTQCTISGQSTHSNFKCNQCPEHLSSITRAKKKEIILQYQIQKLKEQIDHLKRQNKHLIQVQYSIHQANLQKYNPSMYFKEDLQSQLYEAKYLLELHTLSKSQQQNINIKTLSIKESKKQKESFEFLSKPIDLKKKCEELLLENIKLQQKNMIKDKIIQDRTLFPLYHYDQRILTFRKAVEFWYRKAEQQSGRLTQVMIEIKKYQKELKKETKTMLEQERVHWQNELKMIIDKLDQTTNENSNTSFLETLKNNQNQINEKKNFLKSQNGNILIEDDHTILSLCQKIYEKNNPKVKQTKRKSLKNTPNLCESCINLSADTRKKSKNCGAINSKGNKSINKSGKNSAKNDQKYISQGTERKVDEMKRKTGRKSNCPQLNSSNISGKNFENIEIKIKSKCEDHCKKTNNISTKSTSTNVNCQRCAQRIM